MGFRTGLWLFKARIDEGEVFAVIGRRTAVEQRLGGFDQLDHAP